MVHILSDTNSILTVFSAYLRAIIPISMDRKAPGGTTQKKEVDFSTSFFCTYIYAYLSMSTTLKFLLKVRSQPLARSTS